MSEDLSYGAGTYHRTDMLPDSGDEVNSLWGRYALENTEYVYSQTQYQVASFGSIQWTGAAYFYIKSGYLGTIHIYAEVTSGGTKVFNVDGETGGGATLTSGVDRGSIAFGTRFEDTWLLGTIRSGAAGTIREFAVWGQA